MRHCRLRSALAAGYRGVGMRSRASQTGWLATDNPEDGAVSGEGSVPSAGGEVSGVRVARLTLLAVLSVFVSVAALDTVLYPAESQAFSFFVGLPALAAIFVLQLFNSSAAAVRWPAWRRWAMLAALAAATYLPLLVLGEDWMGIAGFLAGSVLLLVRGRAAWALFAAVLASLAGLSVGFGLSPYFVAYVPVST